MLHWLITLLAVALVLLALVYVLAPVIVAVTFRQRIDDRITRLRSDAELDAELDRGDRGDPDAASAASTGEPGPAGAESVLGALPSELIAAVRAHLDRLIELGFEEIGWYRHEGRLQRMQTIVAVAGKRDERLVGAVAAAMVAIEGDARLQSLHVEVSCELADGSELSTSNSDALIPPGALADHFLLQVPEVADPAVLCQIQRRLMAHVGVGTSALRAVPEADAWPGEIGRKNRCQIDHMAASGLVAPTADGVTYRPTLRGAIVLTWGLLWPISSVRRGLRQRRTNRILERLDMARVVRPAP